MEGQGEPKMPRTEESDNSPKLGASGPAPESKIILDGKMEGETPSLPDPRGHGQGRRGQVKEIGASSVGEGGAEPRGQVLPGPARRIGLRVIPRRCPGASG